MPTPEEIDAMHTATQLVKIAVGEKLLKHYLQNHDRKFGMRLASAVVNDLLSEKVTDAAHVEFAEDNHELIEETINKLHADEEIRDVITQAVGVMTSIKIEDGDVELMANPTKMLQHVKDRGILTEDGKSPDPSIYLPLVEQFCNKYAPGVAESYRLYVDERNKIPAPSASGSGCMLALLAVIALSTILIVYAAAT